MHTIAIAQNMDIKSFKSGSQGTAHELGTTAKHLHKSDASKIRTTRSWKIKEVQVWGAHEAGHWALTFRSF
jgi:hypothetical protein